jgi:hypothetical protein
MVRVAVQCMQGLLVPREFNMPKPFQKSQIKIILPADEHDRIRLASALRRLPMAEFCRSVAVTEATKATKGLTFSGAGKPEPHRPS